MSKIEAYRSQLRAQRDWDAYLLANSGLPGPRGNLELAQAAAAEGSAAHFYRWLAYGPDLAPTNQPEEFLAFCGALGLGWLLAGGQQEVLPVLRRLAADPRWRMREAVAMALQHWGDAGMPALLAEMEGWSAGTPWEQRAVVAALCEPRLLVNPASARRVLELLDGITGHLAEMTGRKTEAFRVLRQALGYGWSVAIAALPSEGQRLFTRWVSTTDRDVAWVLRENLKKERLLRLDAAWVEACRAVMHS